MFANLALMIVLGQVASPPSSSDPTRLVAQLGSGRYAERQSAAAALERLGRKALPALRSVRDTKDPEIRSRAAALVSKIEGAMLTQPTLVRLDYVDRPLAEVIKGVGDQCGMKMVLYPEQMPALQERRITLREGESLPFWKAMDRLCETAQLQYNFGGMQAHPNSSEPVFPLFQGGNRPTGPMSDGGPFRVNLVSLHYQRDVSFFGGPQGGLPNRAGLPRLPDAAANFARPGHTLSEQFFVQLQVAAEPRLSLSQNGPLKILEAVDELGQSLLLPANNGPMAQRFSGYFGLTPGSTLPLHAPLNRPENPGKMIKKLRGVLPVLVATRKPGPLVVPLSGALGKSFHNDAVTLVVQDIKVNANTRQTSIDIALRSNQNQEAAATAPAVPGIEFAIQRPDPHQQQIEVLDAQGRPIPWYQSNDGEGSRMTLTLTPHEQGTPTEIRYYSMAKAATEVRFEFNDVPMP